MSYRIRGYDFPWINGHPQENLLKDILQKTLGDSTSNALEQIDMEKSTLSNMHKGKALSEEQFASVNDALDNYKQKINKMSEHNNTIFGSDGQVTYKPEFKVKINDDGHFINQTTGERVQGDKLGRVNIKSPFENMSREELEALVPKLESMRDGLQEQVDELKEQISSKPNTSQTKVEDTKKQYHHQTESHNTQTTNPPPTPPNSTPNTASKPQADSVASNNRLPKTVSSHSTLDLKKASTFLQKNRGKIALGGLGFGLAKSIVDGEDDDMLSAAGKGVKAAVITTGASYAAEYAFKNKTVQDLIRGEIVDDSKLVRDIANTQRKSVTKTGKLGIAYRIGMIALAGATTVDVLQRYGDKRDAEKLKKQQEWELKKKEKRMREKNKEKSYGYVDSGEIVFDMFNSRSGHHKMGNAKFY